MTDSHSWKFDISRYGAFILCILALGTMFLSTGINKYSQLLGMAVILFTFGLRHALDPDNEQLAAESKIYSLFMKMLNLVNHNWQVAIVGFLFGLGFDTATQEAFLATSATATTAGVPW